MKMKSHWGQTLFLAGTVAFFFTIVLPLQTYLNNRELFDFSCGAMLLEVAPVTVILFGVLCGLLWLSDRFLKRWLHVILLAILICEYLETGVLSIGLPPLDGDLMAYGNPFRKIIDTSILIAVFICIVVLGRWIRCVLHWITLACCVMFVAALMDVRPQERVADKVTAMADGFCLNRDVIKNFKYSPERNVMVLMLDSAPASLMADVMRENPELRRLFPGVTAYDNNIGMHYQTRRGLPGLMTGIYLEPDVSASDYTMSVYGTNSFLFTYASAGCPTFFSGSMLPMGYANRRKSTVELTTVSDPQESSSPVFFRNSKEVPYISLFEVLVLRMVPYRYKERALRGVCTRLYQLNAGEENPEMEEYLYPQLAKAPVTPEHSTNLFVAITHGVHPPIMLDREGKTLSTPQNDISGMKELAYYRLTQLGDLFKSMQERGLYDKTFIVATTDHGCIFMKTNNIMHGAESAMLWVKPFCATNDFRSTDIPTSHCKIAQLINSVRENDLSESVIDSMLKTDKRLFRAKHGSTWYSMGKSVYYYDWLYDAEGKLLSYENKGVFEAN